MGKNKVEIKINLFSLSPFPFSLCLAKTYQTYARGLLIMNGTKCPDVEWRSLYHEPLVQAQWVGGFYRQKLAEKIQKLGYRIYNTEHGFELLG